MSALGFKSIQNVHEWEAEQFHIRNPQVYEKLVKLARDLSDRGHRRIGIGMLFEVLRWQHLMDTEDEFHDFKLNNNYRAYYARMIMRKNPDLLGVFVTRKTASE